MSANKQPVKRKVDEAAATNASRSQSMALASAAGVAEESPSRARVRTESWEAHPGGGGSKSLLSRVLMKHTDTPVTATLRLKDSADSYVEFSGFSFGARKSMCGEVVFNTGMVGYPESLTDPSYRGQILVLTYPLVGNYGVPDETSLDEHGLPKNFESHNIHIRGLIVSDYSLEHSHWAAKKSLGDWLKKNGIPGIFGVDTRMLTKKLRSAGAMLGAVVFDNAEEIEFQDPNRLNLVAEVSTKKVTVYGRGNPRKVIGFDCGMKFNIIRYLVRLGVELTVVPFDFDLASATQHYDGIFISNGPGDPTMAEATVRSVRWALTQEKPIFGICLGNQILALAAGARTFKLKYGNRGMNQPCIDLRTARCYITPQNHGFAVDPDSLPADWRPMFINANDMTNEGIIHEKKPFFSVQFHPEACGGPTDTSFLFKDFLESLDKGQRPPITTMSHLRFHHLVLRKVLLIGSGGLSIGQAGEFDYSGSQAIKALKEEGIDVVLINPNIATVQTSKGLADRVYFLPATAEFALKVIEKERPDGIVVSMGGQTALNVGVQLWESGALQRLNVQVLGTPIDAIQITEDREAFSACLTEIGEHSARSISAATVEDAVAAGNTIGYPVLVRAAFALGGLGSGFADDEAGLRELATRALAVSPQVIIDQDLRGWKEVEYEVVRDCNDNCITVCNMENFDPLGIHTGDSIVVAPSQTLSNREFYKLREVAIKVVRKLGVVGECNIQYALDPRSERYCIIEVNARLSRSSALASKATGYPLAYVACKLALGKDLVDLRNTVTGTTTACFEPSLDYVTVKMPRWDLQKFSRVSNDLGSSMKSVGEVMAIGRKFEETFQKALRMVDANCTGFHVDPAIHAKVLADPTLLEKMFVNPSPARVKYLASAFELGWEVEKIHQLTRIDRWFLVKLRTISDMSKALTPRVDVSSLSAVDLRLLKCRGFSDSQIAVRIGSTELDVRKHRKANGVVPCVKQIDTLAAEFPAMTNYLYVTYNGSENDVGVKSEGSGGVMVLGCGAYSIGSSVEFDWCAVSCIRTIKKEGMKTIVVNYNPETVSTDYDESDRLYFEELSLERVLDIYESENASGVIVSVGGQIPNNLAMPLKSYGANVLGTEPQSIDNAEDRNKFSRMLDKLHIDQPAWAELKSIEQAKKFCSRVGYPVLVRPSYVLSGDAMCVVPDEALLVAYMSQSSVVDFEHPVVVSKFIENAKELEYDGVACDGVVMNYAISEHVENAGVHSGDATVLLPAQKLYVETSRQVKRMALQIAKALRISGPFNIQFMARDNEIKVIECNLRASRTFPFISKTFDFNFIELATKVMLGKHIKRVPFNIADLDYVGCKVPMFSFTRLQGADPKLGVEMASTGEVACFGKNQYEAYLKAQMAAGFKIPQKRKVLISVGEATDKKDLYKPVQQLLEMKYQVFATDGTATFLFDCGIPKASVTVVRKSDTDVGDGPEAVAMLRAKEVDLVFIAPRLGSSSTETTAGYHMRRATVDFDIPLVTNFKIFELLVASLHKYDNSADGLPITSIDEHYRMSESMYE